LAAYRYLVPISLLVLGLLVAAFLAWAAVILARRRTAALAAAGVAAGSGHGSLAGAWPSRVRPTDKEITAEIEPLLAK